MRGLMKLVVMLTLAAVGFYYIMSVQQQWGRKVKPFTISDFHRAVKDERIDGVIAIRESNNPMATGKLRDGTEFRATLPNDLRTTYEFLDRHSGTARYETKRSPFPGLASLLPFLIMVLIMGGLLVFWMRSMQATGNQAMQFGRSRARRYEKTEAQQSFDDVAGAEEAKEELAEVIDFLKHPEKFQALGAKIPRGVLLVGPPGCGKTLLARAVAGEADVPFFHVSGSDFVEMFVGVGASRIRDLFDQARSHAPCLIFIDELDAVGRLRFAGIGGGHDEREQTLNELLVQMDGFDPNNGIILMAATNRPDVLDPALQRPGRFDRQIIVDNPDSKGRKEILKVHSTDKTMAENVDLEKIAKRTPGLSGADLANILNEAALLAARRDKKQIEMVDVGDAVEKVMAGPERRSRVIKEEERRILAYHEAGHALVTKLLPNGDIVHKVTIVPRGMALGYTLQLPEEDRYIIRRAELLDRLSSLLGGRAAEHLVFNEITTGAQNDLERATELARRMVCQFGMSDKLGPVALGRPAGPVFLGRDLVEDRNYSEEIASQIDREVRSLVDECYERARQLMSDNREALDRVVNQLLEKETIDSDELDELIEGTPVLFPANGSSKEQEAAGDDTA